MYLFLNGVQSLKALTAKIDLITNVLRGLQVFMFPNSNPNYMNAGTKADLSAMCSSEAVEDR